MVTTASDRPKRPGGRPGGAAPEHTAAFTLTPLPPFSWEHSVRFLAGSPPTHGELIVEGDRVIKAWRTADTSVVTRIGPAPDGTALAVDLVSPEPVGQAVIETMADRLRFFLSLDDDLGPFGRTAADDSAFAPVEARHRGYHQVKFPTPVESLVWSIITQRTPMPVSRKIQSRLTGELTPAVPGFGHELQAFPSLVQLAALSELEILDLVGSQRKAAYLHGW
jgi:DNA-3-methyladenine glycosylase II